MNHFYLRSLVAAAFVLLVGCGPVLAQWQVPNYAVPIGRGTGTGFKSAAPGTSGCPLASAGASADPTFSCAIAPAWTGLHSWTQNSLGAGTNTPGLSITQAGSGSATAPSPSGTFLGYAYNRIAITDNIAAANGSPVYGLHIEVTQSSTNFSGGGALFAGVTLSGTNASIVHNPTAITSYTTATSNFCGGTTPSPCGSVYGINSYGRAVGNNLHFINVTGGEANFEVVGTGTDVTYVSGFQIVANDNHAVRGTTYDAYLSMSKKSTAVGSKQGILFSAANGGAPVATDGTLFKTLGSATVDVGFDLASYAFTTAQWSSPNWFVNGDASVFRLQASNASIEIGAGSANTPFIDFHSGASSVDYDARIIAAGGSGSNGGGALTITAASISLPAASSPSFVPTSSSVPSNGMYLPAANTLGWAINSAAELWLTSTALSPAADGGNSLGTTALGWQNLFGNTGFVVNIENGDWVATHSAGILTVGTGDLRVTTAGTNSASVVTVGGTQTLTGKSIVATQLTGTLQAGQAPAYTGDCTSSAGSLSLTCTKTNNVSFTSYATATVGQLPGTTTNDSANAGNIGEYSSGSNNGVSLTTATQTTCTSISLTAGDWDVTFAAYFTGASGTVINNASFSVSETNNTMDFTNGRWASFVFPANMPLGVATFGSYVSNVRKSLSSTTTIYGVQLANFGVSTMTIGCLLTARRSR